MLGWFPTKFDASVSLVDAECSERPRQNGATSGLLQAGLEEVDCLLRQKIFCNFGYTEINLNKLAVLDSLDAALLRHIREEYKSCKAFLSTLLS
jgi:hypothetical protein